MSAAQKIRIDDLRAPALTPAQRTALAFGEQHRVPLTLDSVLSTVVERTGLDDFGPGDFIERLALWLSEMDEDPDRTGLGRTSLWNDCVRCAANRLRIRALLAEHPEIHRVRIERPIIVVGLPRSGTTHLVNLIAADARLRSLPLWESQEPVPDARERPGPDGVDPRYARSAKGWGMMRANVPLLAAMHPMSPDHIHEELELMLPDFSSYNQEWIARAPRWRDYYLAHDQTPHYAYLKTVLQILQWRQPRERWVLKSPQHLEQLGPLLATFPDATIVVTHRDPVSVVQSAATMLAYGARINYRTPEPDWYLAYWTDRIRRLLEASVRDRALLPAGRTLDVLFHEFMADDLATVERIYEVAGLPMTDPARAQIADYLRDHPRGKEGQVVYDLRRDFGAEPAAVREPFGFYFERFPVKVEVS
ncbi:MAG TPA: sulfotransferase [Myxococcota bacterium]|nr:sulfotransferase [Myxococcota bacterium]